MMRCAGWMTVWLILAVGGPLHAAPDKDEGDGPTTSATATGNTGAKNQQGPSRSQKPARTFKPSERIRADSAVSFPVDI